MARANLEEAELTRKPADWLPYDEWLKEYRATYARRERIPLRYAEWPQIEKTTADNEAMTRWKSLTASLEKISLQGQDLRGASLIATFLAGADLRHARIQGADLTFAEMQGADLTFAEMQGAYLREAQMQGADLREAQMQGADLREAQMQGADLTEAAMQGANLYGAQMQGAFLGYAAMQGADLYDAAMQGAILWNAQMQGANLFAAQMQGAILQRAKMSGADLSYAKMADSDCTDAVFLAALVHSADLTCLAETLEQSQLLLTVGNKDTVLPEGLWVWSCLDEQAADVQANLPEIEDALSHHAETFLGKFQLPRAELREQLFCGEGEVPEKVGGPASQ